MGIIRKRFEISGRIQGVGFRPQAYRLAQQLQLTGWVRNHAAGVCLELQGARVDEWMPALLSTLPQFAHIRSVQVRELSLQIQETDFKILPSLPGIAQTTLTPDLAICRECLQELFSVDNPRLEHYPFLSCTQCGPRFTMTYSLPYDRSQTSMAIFGMCDACQAEYADPNDRRYHAQSIACRDCGPELSVVVADLARSIQQGQIVMIKGLGGYQLVCDAYNPQAIARLREIKLRPAKPLAMMMLNIPSVRLIAHVEQAAESLLNGAERPIVLLPQISSDLPIAHLAPNLSRLGVMLPHTPLHYLLFHHLCQTPSGLDWLEQPHPVGLVVTSANLPSSPMLTEVSEAVLYASKIGVPVASDSREIVARLDDSVQSIIHHKPFFIRRARGYVPIPIELPFEIPSVLGLGGELKNTFCLTRGQEAFLSPHIGNLHHPDTRDAYQAMLNHMMKFLGITPECVVHDLHPHYYTTQLAENYGLPRYAIQHHHAHLAAVVAEHGIEAPVLGLALDGHGYGLDGTVWGGELCLLSDSHMQRLAHLQPLPLPGGDHAAREPWRMGVSVLHQLGRNGEVAQYFGADSRVLALSEYLRATGRQVISTTSCGRWFDAVAAILGVHTQAQYEGQAAMQLESLVTESVVLPHTWQIVGDELRLLTLVERLLGKSPQDGANQWHGTLVAALTDWVSYWSKQLGIDTVVLSGGCFLNKILSEGLIHQLSALNFQVLFPRQAPPNDGGLALGQAWLGGLLSGNLPNCSAYF